MGGERPDEYASKTRFPPRLLKLRDDDAGALETLGKAIPDMPRDSAESLLFAYAATGQARLLGSILDSNVVDVNTKRAKDGCTALHVASYKGKVDAVAALVAHGADTLIRNKWGETPGEAALAAPLGASPGS